MKTIDVNIVPTPVANNVQLISKIGSNLGTQIFKVEVRMAWAGGQEGFERDKKAYETGEKKGFMLNRSPKRLLAKNFLIAGTILTKDPISEEVGIAINPKDDGTCDLFLPINENTLNAMGKTTVEAISEAVKGQKDHFFLDGKMLAKVLNDAMRREISDLENLIVTINKMIVTLKGDIAENENKARLAEEQWIKSAPKHEVDFRAGNAVINITETE